MSKISVKTAWLAALLALSLILFLLWFRVQSVSNSVLAYMLNKFGFSEVKVERFLPKLNSTLFSNLSLVYPFSSGSIRLETKELEISYSLATLRAKNLDHIKLSEGRAEVLSHDSEVAAGSGARFNLFNLIPALRALPFRQLNVADFKFFYLGHGVDLNNLEFITRPDLNLQFEGGIAGSYLQKINISFLDEFRAKVALESELGERHLECLLNMEIVSNSSLKLLRRDSCNFEAKKQKYVATLVNEARLEALSSDLKKVSAAVEIKAEDFLAELSSIRIVWQTARKLLEMQIDSKKFKNKLLSFDNAKLNVGLDFSNGFSVTDSSQLNIETLHFGLPFSDILLKYSQDARGLGFISGRTTVAGGVLQLLRGKIQPSKSGWKLSFKGNDISLKQLLSSYPQTAVEIEGRMDLQFDLIKTPNGFEIHEGHINTGIEGGVISVTKEKFADNHPELSLVMDQLRNFHYEKLEGLIDLDDEGNLTLLLSIQGRNPKMESKRVINLNLKLEDNLFDLASTIQLIQ